MKFPRQLVEGLAPTGANIVIDAQSDPAGEVRAVVQLWSRGTGSVTIRNASRIPPADLIAIAQALGSRVTLEE